MKITCTVDELLEYFSNLNAAVSILIRGCIINGADDALRTWDLFRKKETELKKVTEDVS
jgi:hypothetical protein